MYAYSMTGIVRYNKKENVVFHLYIEFIAKVNTTEKI